MSTTTAAAAKAIKSSVARQFQGPLARAKKLAVAQAAAVGAPPSVHSIPSTVRYGPIPLYRYYDPVVGEAASVAIRDLGPSRRIFLLDPHLNVEEMDGLAYRIRNLSKNQSLNSILLSNAPSMKHTPSSSHTSQDIHVSMDPDRILPTSIWEHDSRHPMHIFQDSTSPKMPLEIWHVCGGYHPQSLGNATIHEKRDTLMAVQNLAMACWGGVSSLSSGSTTTTHSRIPLITVPHGLLSDGGYAIAMGSHVLATQDSSFVIQNPQRGLALDPIGLSYTLPRLGQEFRQPSAKYPVGAILALTGYEADAADMVETGLATHYMESFRQVAPLERILMELPSWEQQKLMKPEKTFYTGKSSSLDHTDSIHSATVDINAKYRNVAIAHYLHTLCMYDAAGQEFSNTPSEDEAEFWQHEDPSLVLEQDRGRAYGDRESLLVNIAATFTFFESEKSVHGIMERLKAMSSRPSLDEEEKEASDIAKRLLRKMETASPLALMAVHRLMELGKGKMESLEQCMEREAKVQLKLMMHSDFEQWAKSGLAEGSFRGWKHKRVKDVTADEVESLFQDS